MPRMGPESEQNHEPTKREQKENHDHCQNDRGLPRFTGLDRASNENEEKKSCSINVFAMEL